MIGDRIHHNWLLCPHPRHRLFTPIGSGDHFQGSLSGDHFQKVCKGEQERRVHTTSFLPSSIRQIKDIQVRFNKSFGKYRTMRTIEWLYHQLGDIR